MKETETKSIFLLCLAKLHGDDSVYMDMIRYDALPWRKF